MKLKNFAELADKFCEVKYLGELKNKKFLAFLEVEPIIYHFVMKKKKINIGWQRCKVYEEIGNRFCENCSRLVHIEKKCPNENTKNCFKCMGDHAGKECHITKLKYINCVEAIKRNKKLKRDINHSANHYKKVKLKKLVLNILDHK